MGAEQVRRLSDEWLLLARRRGSSRFDLAVSPSSCPRPRESGCTKALRTRAVALRPCSLLPAQSTSPLVSWSAWASSTARPRMSAAVVFSSLRAERHHLPRRLLIAFRPPVRS